VNTSASEVLFEMRFNAPTDFNPSTGLTPVYKGNTAKSQITGETNLPSESIVFSAMTVTSYFKQGKFTQKLTGSLRQFEAPSGSNTTQPVAGTNVGNTSTTPTVARDPATTRQPYEPFDYDTYNSNAGAIDDAGGVEAINSQQLNYANYADVAGTIDDAGGVESTNQTGTGTSLAQSSAIINEDANNDEVSSSGPTPTVAGQAPDDDAGYDP